MPQNLSAHRRMAHLVSEDFVIPSDTAGISLHLHNKRPSNLKAFSPERTILMMHGATYSSGSLFDVPLGGLSFMDHLAAQGYDVYALDVRGYGGSTRPPEMSAPAEEAAPGSHRDCDTRPCQRGRTHPGAPQHRSPQSGCHVLGRLGGRRLHCSQ